MSCTCKKNYNFNLEAHQCRIQGEGVKAKSLGGISIQLTSNQIEEIVERNPQVIEDNMFIISNKW
jgi:hypothetical protein